MVIEQFRRAHEEELKRRAGPETEGPTIRETLTNKQRSEYFRIYLLNRESPLAERLLSAETLEPDERNELSRQHEEFLRVMKAVEETRNRLRDPQYLESLGRRSPSFRALLREVGTPGARDMLAQAFTAERALRDWEKPEDVLGGVIRSMNEGVAAETALQGHEVLLNRLRTQYGVSEAEYAEVLKIEDDPLRRELLRKLAIRNMSTLEHLFGGAKRIEQRINELDWRQDILQGLDEIDRAMAASANLFAGLADADPVARQAYVAALRGEPRRPEERPDALGFKEAREKIPTPETASEKYKDFKATPEFEEWLVDARGNETAVRERFADRYFNETIGKQGGWGMVLMALFRELFRHLP